MLLTNSTLPQLITKFVATNTTEINRLKKDIADDDYIDDYINESTGPIGHIQANDNHFRHALFAHWIRDTVDFPKLKATYKAHAPALVNTTVTAAAKQNSKIKSIHYVITNDVTLIRDTFGVTPFTARLSGSQRVNVIVPKHLQAALFDEWTQKPNVVRVLGRFARDMDLPLIVTNANGTRLAIWYPDPPVIGYRNDDYRYEKYGERSIQSTRNINNIFSNAFLACKHAFEVSFSLI